MKTIEQIRSLQLNRLRNAIRRYGPVTWNVARETMAGRGYDRRDDRMANKQIQHHIAAGELTLIILDSGDTLLNL